MSFPARGDWGVVFRWPDGFERVPDEDWTRAPVASLAQKYDAVGRHGWYANLDATVEDLARELRDGQVLVDYSGGTGLLIDRLLARLDGRGVGVVNVDSSPKFLALAAQKLGHDPRVAFRLIEYVKQERRLETLEEAIAGPLARRGVDAIVSANAIHLYYDLPETLAAWHRALRPRGYVHVQSGNIRHEGASTGAWIIDDTVQAVDAAARSIVKGESRFARHRATLDDAPRMAAYDAFRAKVFLPPRPLSYYLDALLGAGFAIERVWTRPIRALATDWYEFLAAYSDAVLGWVGGTEKVDGKPSSKEDLDDRLALMRLGLDMVLTGNPSFDATWTYVTARRS